MKSQILILISVIIMFFMGCEKSDNDLKVESIIDTKWTLSN